MRLSHRRNHLSASPRRCSPAIPTSLPYAPLNTRSSRSTQARHGRTAAPTGCTAWCCGAEAMATLRRASSPVTMRAGVSPLHRTPSAAQMMVSWARDAAGVAEDRGGFSRALTFQHPRHLIEVTFSVVIKAQLDLEFDLQSGDYRNRPRFPSSAATNSRDRAGDRGKKLWEIPPSRRERRQDIRRASSTEGSNVRCSGARKSGSCLDHMPQHSSFPALG